MSRREAKRWACGLAASILEADTDVGILGQDDPTEADRARRVEAWKELVAELRRRGDEAR